MTKTAAKLDGLKSLPLLLSIGCVCVGLLFAWLYQLIKKPKDDVTCLKIFQHHIEREKYLFSSPLTIGFQLHSSGCITETTDTSCSVFLKQPSNKSNSEEEFYLKSKITININNMDQLNKKFNISIHPIRHDQSIELLPSELLLELICNEKSIDRAIIPLSTEVFSEQVLYEFNTNNYPNFNQINILIAGEVGSGKSTLVNSIFTCVNEVVKFTVPALMNNNHTTVESNKLRLNVLDYKSRKSIGTNISIIDTVGITKYNYNNERILDLLLSGANPDHFLEGNIQKIEADNQSLEKKLKELSITFELKQLSVQEEEILELYIKTNNPEIKNKLLKYMKNEDWDSYFEKRKNLLLFKQENFGNLEKLEIEFHKTDFALKENKKILIEEREKLEKNLSQKKPEKEKMNSRIHTIILLVSHATMDSDEQLRENIQKFIKAVSGRGIFPIIGVTHLNANDEKIIMKSIKQKLGAEENNIFLVPFNKQKGKNFQVDKKIFAILLEAVRRGNQFKEQIMSKIKDEL